MCTQHIPPEMAGLHAGHLEIVKRESPLDGQMVEGLYVALTKNLNPHLPVFAALVAMVEAVRKADYGVLKDYRLVRAPLSIIGMDKVRYRTQVVEWMHETILSFRMSELTDGTVRAVLRPHGLCVLFLCSCGVVVGRCADLAQYRGSPDHQEMDRLRSAIDVAGHPVEFVDRLDDIPVSTMDLHSNGAEARLLARVEELTRLAATAGHIKYDWVDAELESFVSRANPTQPEVAMAA